LIVRYETFPSFVENNNTRVFFFLIFASVLVFKKKWKKIAQLNCLDCNWSIAICQFPFIATQLSYFFIIHFVVYYLKEKAKTRLIHKFKWNTEGFSSILFFSLLFLNVFCSSTLKKQEKRKKNNKQKNDRQDNNLCTQKEN